MKTLYDMILREGEGVGAGAPVVAPVAAPVVADPAVGAPAATPPAVEPAPAVAPVAKPAAKSILGDDPEPDAPAAPAAPAKYADDPALTADENAAKKAEFDAAKTKAAADGVINPASYEIKLIEGEALDPEIDREFREYAVGKKLTQDDVDKLTGFQRKVMEKQAENLAANVENWGNELRANKEIGGADFEKNCGLARAARDAFFPPAIKDVLKRTGMGNYPDFVLGMYRIGKAMGEAGIVPGGKAQTQQSPVDILYGDTQ